MSVYDHRETPAYEFRGNPEYLKNKYILELVIFPSNTNSASAGTSIPLSSFTVRMPGDDSS